MNQDAEKLGTSLGGTVAGTVGSGALVVVGVLTELTWPFVVGLALAIVVLVGLSIRHARTHRPFFARWKVLSESARSRMRDVYRRRATARNAGALLMMIAVVLTVSSAVLAVRSEIIRGANMDDPGRFFVLYNRFAAPEIADLVDLYVVRDIPLTRTNSADLRILRNLYFAVEGYRFTAEDLNEIFGSLLWYRPYRAFPNDINALPPTYRDRVEQIRQIEASRK